MPEMRALCNFSVKLQAVTISSMLTLLRPFLSKLFPGLNNDYPSATPPPNTYLPPFHILYKHEKCALDASHYPPLSLKNGFEIHLMCLIMWASLILTHPS